MTVADRILYLAIGCFIGFMLGYIASCRFRQENKCPDDDDDTTHGGELMHSSTPPVDLKKRRSSIAPPSKWSLRDWALLIVVVLTAFAAFSSQKSSDTVQENQNRLTKVTQDLQDTQARLGRVLTCNQQFLSETIVALNERTTYTQDQADANVLLQKNQLKFLGVLGQNPPASKAERTAAFSAYLDALTNYVAISGKAASKTASNPYPTVDELNACLAGK